MMKSAELLPDLRAWFKGYIAEFDRHEPDVQRNFDLKENHSYRVVEEITAIARSERQAPEEVAVAEIAGLFHDVGRFEQYFRYRTFMDPLSADHGELGCRVLRERRPLTGLPPELEERVIAAVAAHNQRDIPAGLDPETLRLTMMLRDADKLDIWKVVLEYYRSASQDPTVKLGLSDAPRVSPKVFRDLLDHRTADKNDFRTVADFQLCQTSWVYDLNYPWSRRAARERGYLRQMAEFMAPLPEVRTIYSRAQAYLYAQ